MEIINYTEARNNLAHFMDMATEDHLPIAITRQKGKAVVMISLDDFNGWLETNYLLGAENNRKRLLAAKDRVSNYKKAKSGFKTLEITDL